MLDENALEGQETNELNQENNNMNHLPNMETLLEEEGLDISLPKSGEIRTGVIAAVTENEILVSVGAKSEGVISGRELEQMSEEERNSLQVGQEIPVYIVNPEDKGGNLVLSYNRAKEEQDWEEAYRLLENGEAFESKIIGYNKGGLLVPLGRVRGFVPASQVSTVRRVSISGNTPEERWGSMVGEPITVAVIEVDKARHRLILSEKAALQETRESLKERLLEELSVGDVRTGRVTSLADFGAFINIEGADGLVHLSEISWDRINHPSEVLKVGQEVQVKIINIDYDNKRIGLSIRQLQEDPWAKKVAHLRNGQLVEGTITHLAKFGAFARLEDSDLEGLIHISELSDDRVEHPKEVVSVGETLTLRIINIDTERRRIGLSLRKVDDAGYADLDWKLLQEEWTIEEEDEGEAVSEQPEEGVSAEEVSEAEASVEETQDSEAAEAEMAAEEDAANAGEEPADEEEVAEASEEKPEGAETA